MGAKSVFNASAVWSKSLHTYSIGIIGDCVFFVAAQDVEPESLCSSMRHVFHVHTACFRPSASPQTRSAMPCVDASPKWSGPSGNKGDLAMDLTFWPLPLFVFLLCSNFLGANSGKNWFPKKQVGITIPEKAIETNGEGFVDFWIVHEAPSIWGRPNCKGDVQEWPAECICSKNIFESLSSNWYRKYTKLKWIKITTRFPRAMCFLVSLLGVCKGKVGHCKPGRYGTLDLCRLPTRWKTRRLFYLASHHLVSISSMCKIVLSISCLQQPFVCLNCVCLQRKQQVSPRALRLMQCRCTRLHLTPRKLFSISGGKVWSVSTQRFLPYTFSGARIGTDQGRLEREKKKKGHAEEVEKVLNSFQ